MTELLGAEAEKIVYKGEVVCEEKDRWRLNKDGKGFIPGGNTSPMICGLIRCDSSHGCPRRILLRNYGIEPPVGEETQKIFDQGAAWEDRIEDKLKEQGVPYEKEKRLKKEIDFGVSVTCSADYIINDDTIIEAKSVNSDKRAKSTFVHNEFKLDHMTQMCLYMILFGMQEGILAYGLMLDEGYKYNYKGVKKNFKKFDSKQFRVYRKDKRFIWIHPETNKESLLPFTSEHLLRALAYKAWVLEEKVHDSLVPVAWSEYFKTCHYCEFNSVCNSIPESFEEFIEKSRELVKKLESDDVPF